MWHYRAALAVIALDHANYEDDENSFIVASEEERYNATTQYMRTSTSLSTCSMAWPRRTSCTSNTLWSSTHGRAANDSFNGHDAARVQSRAAALWPSPCSLVAGCAGSYVGAHLSWETPTALPSIKVDFAATHTVPWAPIAASCATPHDTRASHAACSRGTMRRRLPRGVVF